MGLFAESRHKFILDMVRSDGKVQVVDLARQFDVTEVTIRRDLVYLEKKGLLKKTYGGAVMAGSNDFDVSVKHRHTKNLSAKKNIGKLASTIINDGDNIYLEAGSTCYEIVPYLADFKNLTIITNSLLLMNRLHEQTQHKIIITGGQYRPDRMDMIGPAAEVTISQLSGFIAFTGADDISIDTGISGADISTVSFTKQILRKATKSIFVGTKAKFDKAALYKIADLRELDYIVTDHQLSEKWHHAARENNIRLIYPNEPSE